MTRAVLRQLAFVWPLTVLGACASVPSADEVTRMGVHALVGDWTSELDGTTLSVRKDGTFTVARAARGDRPAASAAGHWHPRGDSVVLVNDTGSDPADSPLYSPLHSTACADIEGIYTPEIVRDTVRFALVSDNCAPREEQMAWPWKRGGTAIKPR
jgi:hypothetical protein